MKKHSINYIISFLILAIAVVSFSGCGDDGEDENPTVKRLTSGTWKLSSVTVDGVNQDALFQGFAVSFTTKGFSAVNGDPVWPASGTWTFGDPDKKIIRRNDGVDVTIESLTDNTLKLSLNWTKGTLSGGRVSSVSGNHVFELVK